jgi:hypothetical protein
MFEIYEAKAKNPSRWSGKTRNWDAVTTVKLNPLKEKINRIQQKNFNKRVEQTRQLS